MTRYTLHVPLVLNDGTSTPEDVLGSTELELLQLAGGFTATDGYGGWIGDGGTIYREPVRLYAVDAEGIEPELLQLADRIADRLDQEAVYLTRSPIAVQLVSPIRA